MTKINLLNYSISALENFFLELGEKPFRATQLLKWIYQLGNRDFATMTNLSQHLRQYLITHCEIAVPEQVEEQIAVDGTKKWLLRLVDGNFIETVYIPEDGRGTLCVSSQVGCPVGCSFCATGFLGFKRNLSLAEIIGQLWFAVHKLSPLKGVRAHAITNVVFMGMGEPLLNYESVIQAVELMLSHSAYGLSKYRVTLSTCGIVPGLRRLRNDSEIAIAISLHAVDDVLRSQLIPINEKFPLTTLMEVCNDYFKDRRRFVTIEYIMLDGINDSLGQARQLAKLLSHGRYKVNLIPGNLTGNDNFRPSRQEQIDSFRGVLLATGINTITRKSRGAEIRAACGQLMAKTI